MANMGVVAGCGTAIGINSIYQIQHSRDPFPVILIGSVWMGACAILEGIAPSLGSTLAMVYLLAVIVTRGLSTLTFFTDLVNGVSK